MAWSDEKKAQAIQLYKDAEPTPENTIEVLKEIAEELDESANGVRAILSKAGVYVKKAEGSKSPSTKTDGAKSTRVSKEEAHGRLTAAIEAAGKSVDSDIVSKLTGKAALYFAEILETE